MLCPLGAVSPHTQTVHFSTEAVRKDMLTTESDSIDETPQDTPSTQPDITIDNTSGFKTLPEIHCTISHHLSIEDNINLARTSWFHLKLHEQICLAKLKKNDPKVNQLLEEKKTAQYLFLHHPDCRKDEHVPRDENGRAYLRSLGIGGPLRNREIANGALTIEDIQAEMPTARFEISKKLTDESYRCMRLVIEGRAGGVIRYYIDGSLTFERIRELNENEMKSLERKGVQKYIDNHTLTVENAIKLSSQGLNNLDSWGVQKYIGNQLLTIDQAIALNLVGFMSLNSKVIQKYIDDGSLSIERASNLTWSGYIILTDQGIQQLINQGSLTAEQASKLTKEEILDLPDEAVQHRTNDAPLIWKLNNLR